MNQLETFIKEQQGIRDLMETAMIRYNAAEETRADMQAEYGYRMRNDDQPYLFEDMSTDAVEVALKTAQSDVRSALVFYTDQIAAMVASAEKFNMPVLKDARVLAHQMD